MLQSFQTHNLKKVAVSKEPAIHDKVSSMYFVSKATDYMPQNLYSMKKTV